MSQLIIRWHNRFLTCEGTNIATLGETLYYRARPIQPVSSALQLCMSGQNHLRAGYVNAIPLQFVYKAADC